MVNQSAGGTRRLAAIIAAIATLVLAATMKADRGPDAPASRVYRPMAPRWQFPPIANPYFIGWYGAHTPSRPGFETALLLQTQTMETDAPAKDLAWWYGRGIMACPWAAGTQVRP